MCADARDGGEAVPRQVSAAPAKRIRNGTAKERRRETGFIWKTPTILRVSLHERFWSVLLPARSARASNPRSARVTSGRSRLPDGPAEHHVVVLVRQVVAVGHVVAEEGAEPPVDGGLLARLQRHHVFLPGVV